MMRPAYGGGGDPLLARDLGQEGDGRVEGWIGEAVGGIDGEQAGALVAWVGPSPAVTAGDLSILRIVANQSAVALLSERLGRWA